MSRVIIRLMTLAIAALATTGLWADGEVTPLMLLNFHGGTEVSGWYNTTQTDGGTIPKTGTIETNDVSFAAAKADGSFGGNFSHTSGTAVNTDFSDGTYLDVFGMEHNTIADEIKSSLGLDDSFVFSTDVYKKGIVNGGQNSHVGTISGLDSGAKYVVYIGTGLQKSGQVMGVRLEPSFYASCQAIEYVTTVENGSTTVQTFYQEGTINTDIKPGNNGLLVVRLKNVMPTAAGKIKFRMVGDRAGINWLAVAKVNATVEKIALEASGATTWSALVGEQNLTDKIVTLTLDGNTTVTLDQAMPTMASFTVKKGAAVDGACTLKLICQEALVPNMAIEEGVDFNEVEIPANAVDTVRAAAQTIPAGRTLIIDGMGKTEEAPLEITGKLEVAGSLVTKGNVKLSYNGADGNATGNVVSGTMEVMNGTTAIKFNDRGMQGTLTIDEGATLKPFGYVDAVKYDGSTTVNVYGTLDLSDTWARWTVRGDNTMNFYVGAKLIGNGQSGNNTGAIQPNTATTFHFLKKTDGEDGSIQFKALYHSQVASTFAIEEGVTVVMENASGLGTGKEPITVSGNGTLVFKSEMPFNAPITVNETATVVIETTGSLTQGATGAGVVEFKATEIVLGTSCRAPLTLAIPAEATSVSLQATDAEMAEGSLTLNFTNETMPAGLIWTVTKSDGAAVSATAGAQAEDGTVTIDLGVTKFTASTETKDWPAETAGRVVIQGVTEEGQDDVTLTFNHELPTGVEEIYFVGKVIVAADGMTLPSGKFKFAPGADVTLSTDLRAETTTVTEGATVRLANVTLTKNVAVQNAATVVVEGAVSAPKIALAGSNATLTIAPGATFTATAAQPFSAVTRGYGTFNIYGTIDLGQYNWNHNFNGNTINCYAGGKIVGTTGQFICGGGSGTTYYLKNCAESAERAFTFDVIMGEDFGDYPDTYACEDNVGLKILKDNNRTSVCAVSGTAIRGLEIQYGTFKIAANDRCLRDYVKVGANAKLVLDARHDMINYGNDSRYPYEPTLDIAGTLQVDKRQTMFAANSITLRNGAQITGTGEVHQTINKALHVCRDLTISLDGVSTIAATNSIDNTRTVTLTKAADATAGVVVVEKSFSDRGSLKVTGGAIAVFAGYGKDKLATVPENAEGLVVALNDGVAYTKANGVVTLTIPEGEGQSVELGTATLRGSLPAGLAASNPKYQLKVRGGKLMAEKPAFTFIIQ